MDIAKVKALADGRVYTGQQAQAVGLVDELGNYYDALEAAGKAIGVDGIPEIKENKRQKPWEVFFSAQLSKMMLGQLEMLLQKDAAGMSSPQAARGCLMRRKTFDVLFETRDGMRLLVQERCMWRSLWYFALSVGLFSGVVTNQLFLDQALSVRFAVIAAAVSIAGVVLSMYGFLLHGILETLGAMAGDAVGLICLLGYTTLPFLVMTPVALLGTKLGLPGMLVVVGACITAKLWMLYLLIRALQVVYLIDFKRSLATVAFSLLLLYIAFVLPLQIVFELLMLKIS